MKQCESVGPDGYHCSLPAGHEGDHEVLMSPFAPWPEPSPTPEQAPMRRKNAAPESSEDLLRGPALDGGTPTADEAWLSSLAETNYTAYLRLKAANEDNAALRAKLEAAELEIQAFRDANIRALKWEAL